MPRDSILDRAPVQAEEVRTELEAISRSQVFKRSDRVRRFLEYVCELTLKGEAHRINEYLIGSEVFQKGPQYNPNEDSIVRRQAHTLRQKLQDYYAAEGRNRAIHIELPVGRYVPEFRRRVEHPQVESGVAATQAYRPRMAVHALLLGAILSGVFVGGLVTGKNLWGRTASHPLNQSVPEAVQEIWGAWFGAGHEPILCFSNPLTAVIKHFEKPVPPDALPRRLKADLKVERMFRESFRLPPGGHIYYTPVINQTKTGEAIAAVTLSTFFARQGVSVRTTQSRFLSWEDLRNSDMVLMGHDEANQWIDPLLKSYPFRLQPTSGRQQRSIVNTEPRDGEKNSYAIEYSDGDNQADQEYALISMLPGIDGDHQLLLICGLNAQATQMATEYLTKEKSLNELAAELRKQSPEHEGPWRFQAVLKTEVYDKVPTRAALVTARVIP